MSFLSGYFSGLATNLQGSFNRGMVSLRNDDIIPAAKQSLFMAARNAEHLQITAFQDAVTDLPEIKLTPYNLAVVRTPYDHQFIKNLFPETSDYRGYQFFDWIMETPDELQQNLRTSTYATSYILYGFQDYERAAKTPPVISEGSFLTALNPTQILIQTDDRAAPPLPMATAAAFCVYTSGRTSCAAPRLEPALPLSSLFASRQRVEESLAHQCMRAVLEELVTQHALSPRAAQKMRSRFALSAPQHA